MAGAALIVGGILSGRDWERGRQYQLVGWSFMASLLFHSVLNNVSDILMHTSDSGSSGLVALSPVIYTAIEGVLMALSFLGVWTTLTTASLVVP